jgi:hypothetical protein
MSRMTGVPERSKNTSRDAAFARPSIAPARSLSHVCAGTVAVEVASIDADPPVTSFSNVAIVRLVRRTHGGRARGQELRPLHPRPTIWGRDRQVTRRAVAHRLHVHVEHTLRHDLHRARTLIAVYARSSVPTGASASHRASSRGR